MTFDEEVSQLLEPVEAGKTLEPNRKKSADWTSGFQWNGDAGTVTTDPIAGTDPPQWGAVLSIFELNPDEFEIVEPVLFNAWHGGSPEGPVLYRQWKAKVIRKVRQDTVDVSELIDEIKKHKPAKKEIPTAEGSFCVVLADWQIGKEGTTATVHRILKAIDDVENRVKELRKLGRPLGSLYVLWTGDAVEGCIGHYEMQTFSTELDRREQVKVTRRLLRDALIRWSKLFPEVVVVAVGGNHGENRSAQGKAYTSFGDNDDLAVVEQVAEILASNSETYGHVKFIIPKDHLTVTVEVAGWILGLTHGHVARAGGTAEAKLHAWYNKMAGGKQSVGNSDILVTGHYHHLRQADWGGCMWLQAPSLDSGSEWWRMVSGEFSEAGVLTFAVYPDRRVADLEVLS
jgi:predicted phosphodiesterase